jgi:hypothetical protein
VTATQHTKIPTQLSTTPLSKYSPLFLFAQRLPARSVKSRLTTDPEDSAAGTRILNLGRDGASQHGALRCRILLDLILIRCQMMLLWLLTAASKHDTYALMLEIVTQRRTAMSGSAFSEQSAIQLKSDIGYTIVQPMRGGRDTAQCLQWSRSRKFSFWKAKGRGCSRRRHMCNCCYSQTLLWNSGWYSSRLLECARRRRTNRQGLVAGAINERAERSEMKK